MKPAPPQLRDVSAQGLLPHCRWEAFRGSGPGGQKRNKTSSSIRVVHLPTGLSAVAGESRSQSQNRRRALERLRHRIALEVRLPIDLDRFEIPPDMLEFLDMRGTGLRLDRLSIRHERYLDVVGLVLDVLAAMGGSVSEAAAKIGTSSADLVSFLQHDDKLLQRVNRIRKGAGLKPLGAA